MGQGFVLLQDPKHSSKLSQRYNKSKEELHVLQLMAQSVDLNPIELMLDELNQKIGAEQPTSAAHLWQHLQESWAEQSLMERMPRICQAVIAAKGSCFDESKV